MSNKFFGHFSSIIPLSRTFSSSCSNLNEKCKVLRYMESGLSKKEVAAKYRVPKNTVSTWVKNKAKLFTALEQCFNKRKKLRESDYKWVDDVVFNWFLSKRSQDIPSDGVFIKEKTLQWAKELGFNEFQTSDGWLRRQKERETTCLFDKRTLSF